MNDTLTNLMRREAFRAHGDVAQTQSAIITSYDPETHAIKAILQPQGIETGWFDNANQSIGAGYGIAIGPNIGDQILVGFRGGDINSPYMAGRTPSDQDKPPVAKSGEVVIRTKNGTQLKVDQAGAVTIVSNGQPISIDSGGGQISIAGPVAITGDSLTHNGHDIGSTHLHTGVEPGGGLTGEPQ